MMPVDAKCKLADRRQITMTHNPFNITTGEVLQQTTTIYNDTGRSVNNQKSTSKTYTAQMKTIMMQYIRVRSLHLGRAAASASSYTDSMIGQRKFSDKKGAKNDGPKVKQSKVKRKDKPKKDDESGKSREYNLIISALDAPIRKEPPISEEEKARRHEIGRNYTIGRFRFHNQVHQDLTNKIHLKKHAIKMLPRDTKIKEEALKENTESPPPWRPLPTWTPPIPNFDPSQYIVRDDDK